MTLAVKWPSSPIQSINHSINQSINQSVIDSHLEGSWLSLYHTGISFVDLTTLTDTACMMKTITHELKTETVQTRGKKGLSYS